MSPTKINRLLDEALEKYGNIDIIQLIDYYYQETYEGCMDWKVREKITIQDIINAKPDSTFILPIDVHGVLIGIRDILKYLETEEKAINYLPIKLSVAYEDSKQRAADLRAAHPKEEADKKAFLNHAMGLMYNREAMDFVNKIYSFK